MNLNIWRMARTAAVGVLFAASGAMAAEAKGPVAQWDFSEGTGAVLKCMQPGANGTIHGAAWFKCGNGFALQFDGEESYVDCGQPPSLDLRGSMSVEAWIRPEEVPEVEQGVIGKSQLSYAITYDRGGKCYWYISEGSNGVNAPVEIQKWHHIVGAFDGVTVKLYVDGRLAASHPSTHKTAEPGKNFCIGRVQPVAIYGDLLLFTGEITAVRVYDRALDDAEVAAHFKTQSAEYALTDAGTPVVKAAPAAEAAADSVWAVPLVATEWKSRLPLVRSQEQPRRLTVTGGTQADKDQMEKPLYPVRQAGQGTAGQDPRERDTFSGHPVGGAGEGIVFEVMGRVPTLRTMVWTASIPRKDLSSFTHYAFRYRATGIARNYAAIGILSISGRDATGKAGSQSLLDLAQIYNDGAWHTVVGKKKLAFAANTLRAQVETEDSLGTFEVADLAFYASTPHLAVDFSSQTLLEAGDARFEGLDISSQFNDTVEAAFTRVLDKEGMVIDGAPGFSVPNDGVGAQVADSLIPFRWRPAGNNLIRPIENPKVNDEPATVLGAKTTRAFYEPIGRDDRTEVAVGKKTAEVFLLLINEFPKGGAQYNLRPQPHDFADVGALAVELQYKDGDADWAYPYSIADGGYIMQRMAGAFVVPADEKRTLEKVVVHNRLFGDNFNIAAVTVNTGARVFPQLVKTEPVRLASPAAPAASAPVKPYARKEGDLLVLGNAGCEMTVNCANGFSIEKFTSRCPGAQVTLDPVSGLEVCQGDVALTGRAFKTESVEIKDTTATLTLRSASTLPLKLTITLAVDDSPQVRMNLSAANTGTAPLAASFRFPVLRDLKVGSVEDTWIFFPQYRTVITGEKCLYQVSNDRQFPMQFFDVYNPRTGGGVSLLTHNLDNSYLDYSLGKTEGGAAGFVQSPAEFYPLNPGETRKFVEVCLAAHSGDFHQAIGLYRDWRAAWYKPVGRESREWFRRIFMYRTGMAAKNYSWAFPMYDPDKKQWKVDEAVKQDTDYMGAPPEMFGPGGWYGYGTNAGGDFLGGDYEPKDYTGGPEAVKSMVRQFQENYHIPVALYMISDRCAKISDVGKRMGEKVALRRQDGTIEQDAENWYTCPDDKEWQDYYVEAVKRTVKETGAKVIYQDVFGYASGYLCWSKDHGHEVPPCPNKSTCDLISRIRAGIPADVALWCEFPLNDTNAQYMDGNISYYCLNWAKDYFSHCHDATGQAPQCAATARSAYRYAFPDIHQFIFLCGVENWSSDAKFPFFNGEALFDVSCFLYASPHLDRMRKSWAIQRKFVDCFAGLNPTMEVPTEMLEVHANEFPGNGRTVWTLFNARYSTARGQVLAVDHRDGATYYDVWNDKPLQPQIVNGKAVISLALDPQGLGCVVQTAPPAAAGK